MLMTWLPFGLSYDYVVDIAGISISSAEKFGLLVIQLFLHYAYMRLAVALPAASVDEKLGVWGAWRITRGHGLRLFAASYVAYVPFVVAASLGVNLYEGWVGEEYAWPDSPASPDFHWPVMIGSLFEDSSRLLEFALDVVIATLVFRRITGWAPAQDKLVERFD